jgi:hypothetical protein
VQDHRIYWIGHIYFAINLNRVQVAVQKYSLSLSDTHTMASLEIARRKRDQQPLHSLTYRLASRRVLHERSIGSLVAIAGFSVFAAVLSQFSQLGIFGITSASALATLMFSKTIVLESNKETHSFSHCLQLFFNEIGLIRGTFSFYTLILSATYFVFGSLLLGLRNARVKGNKQRWHPRQRLRNLT